MRSPPPGAQEVLFPLLAMASNLIAMVFSYFLDYKLLLLQYGLKL